MNNRTRTLLFTVSGIFVLAGAVMHLWLLSISPYLFAVGAAGVAVYYLTTPVKEMGFRQRRLHRYNIMAGLLMIFASVLMFANRKEWVICLTISALFLLYTAFITPKDEKKS